MPSIASNVRIPGARTTTDAVAPVFVPLATRALRKAVSNLHSIDEAFDVAYGFRVGVITIRPLQVRSEFRSLVAMASERPLNVVLEIGTAQGGTLFVLARAAATGATIISFDHPGGPLHTGPSLGA